VSGGSPDDGYAVDLQLLDETTAEVSRFLGKLSSLVDDVERDVAKQCSTTWSGDAAKAFTEHQSRWEAAMSRARGELEEMRLAAQTAHSNYSAARAANLSMLGR
jgi:WXG100 family type VII secretion target